MQVILRGDDRVIKIIQKKQLSDAGSFRLSQFTHFYGENGRYLIKHTLTKEITELTKAEWDALQQIRTAPASYAAVMENGLEQLALSRYLVENGYDELRQYQQVAFLIKTMSRKPKGYKYYTIFPTTGCNARCVYCFEEGYKVVNMSEETADRLVDFICETRQQDMIKLRWFGGEPLVGARIIHRICAALQDKGVPFRSEMVTNASLLTKELAHEAKELWCLKKVQVSLDGAREDYTARKNYPDPVRHNYDVVMQAIQYFLDEGIRVSLRVNVDLDNMERIPGFLREIKERFGDSELLLLYFSPLYQNCSGEYGIAVQEQLFKMTDLQETLGINRTRLQQQRLKLNFCMADATENSILIQPDGAFHNCEHLTEGRSWGNIFDGVTDPEKLKAVTAPAKIDELCAKCPYLPECTPFFKNGCPIWSENCHEFERMKADYAMHTLLRGENTETDDDDEDV
ncbi:MAG: radical SAM protein [Oscillospiraceae bacterium]|nr:radical SAM protein [Oscillospiraceae bacterium]